MANLTKTQINAILAKLKRDFQNRKTTGKKELSEDQQVSANIKAVQKLIRASNLHPVIKKDVLQGEYTAENIVDDCNARQLKSLDCPYPNVYGGNGRWSNTAETEQDKFEAMLTDLEFELTMAGTENYQEYMDAFNKKVSKAFK